MGRSIMVAMYLCFASFSNFLLAGCGPNPPCDTDCAADCQGAGFATGECVGGACQCSGDAGADADVDADADGDGDGDADLDADIDEEVESTGFDVVVERILDGEVVPAPGATVAFDSPAGVRSEGRTDAAGRVHFENFEWLEGETATVTAHLEGWLISSYAGLTESYVADRVGDDGALHLLPMYSLTPTESELIEVSGNLLNMASTGNQHVVSTYLPASTLDQSMGSDWSILVPPGEPFTVVATEYRSGESDGVLTQVFEHWAAVSHEGVTEPTSFDIDFVADRIEPTSIEGTMPVPEWVDSTEGFTAYIRVFAQHPAFDFGLSMFVGGPTRTVVHQEEGVVDYSVEYVDLGEPFFETTQYAWYGGPEDLFYSYTIEWSPPSGMPPRVPSPPDVTTPGHGTVEFGDTVAWSLGADAADATLLTEICLSKEGVEPAVHIITIPAVLTEVVLPEPPSSVDVATHYGAMVNGRVISCDIDERTNLCIRSAYGETFVVEP